MLTDICHVIDDIATVPTVTSLLKVAELRRFERGKSSLVSTTHWQTDKKLGCNISNTRKSVSLGYPNPKKWVEKTRRSRLFFWTDFEVFGYLVKHSFEFLIWLL